MRIGIDLDNTLADYGNVVGQMCRVHGVETGGGDPKLALRAYLRAAGREAEWTALQGELYGPLMEGAEPFPGAVNFLISAAAAGADCIVVSHRTPRPIAGQAHDLHAAARAWIKGHLPPGLEVHLAETKQEKLSRIGKLRVDVFIDDLPELLGAAGFPAGVAKVLFDPRGEHPEQPGVERFRTWAEIAARLLG
ncbi:MAG: hypothetical protein IAE97_05940 [Chthoniobacterales bacterium]|nr:hypothetical protein [Chthoniobacterales bacterium]